MKKTYVKPLRKKIIGTLKTLRDILYSHSKKSKGKSYEEKKAGKVKLEK